MRASSVLQQWVLQQVVHVAPEGMGETVESDALGLVDVVGYTAMS